MRTPNTIEELLDLQIPIEAHDSSSPKELMTKLGRKVIELTKCVELGDIKSIKRESEKIAKILASIRDNEKAICEYIHSVNSGQQLTDAWIVEHLPQIAVALVQVKEEI